MRLRAGLLASLLVLGLALAGCGGGGDTTARSVDVDMTDAGFQPAQLSFEKGEKVEFTFRNRGTQMHEAVFGDSAFQEHHEEEMEHEPDMPMSKSKDFVEVRPGESRTFSYTFDQAGEFFIGCHVQPGHWARGEKITVTVS